FRFPWFLIIIFGMFGLTVIFLFMFSKQQ
uniref:Growth hormone receptor n=2 Tax=Myotis TaxID=9434 RepID=G1Q4Y1_MYOLU